MPYVFILSILSIPVNFFPGVLSGRRLKKLVRQVTLAEVADDGNDSLACAKLTGYFARRPGDRARRDAAEDALFACEAARHFQRIVVINSHHAVNDRWVVIARNEACADALNLVRAGLAARKHRRRRGLDGDDQHVFARTLAQDLPDASNRAARADAGDESIYASVRIFPNLFGGSAAMNFRIRGVIELSGRPTVFRLFGNVRGPLDRALHAFGTGCEHNLRAEGGQHAATLDRDGLRHRDDELVALDGGGESERDARVAGGRLDDDRLAGLDQPVALGGVDHRPADTVFDGIHRVL